MDVKGGEVLKKYRLEKTARIAGRLEKLQQCGNETLKKVSGVILEKLEFYDGCMKSWDDPHFDVNLRKYEYTPEEIELGRKCCNAAIDMADAIVNELRIMYLENK